MAKELIPQVIKEMPTISLDGKRLSSNRNTKTVPQAGQGQSNEFRYISFNNSVPSLITIKVLNTDKIERFAYKNCESS